MENQGYVYILQSQNCDCIKIGGTDYPPLKRIKEINATEPYKSLGKWELAECLEVKNWRIVEHNLHYRFRSSLNTEIKNQKELFQDEAFLSYIVQLFKFTGLVHWIEQQGIWTFVLFPSTNGGRYFTMNIGSHEVAFSTLRKKDRKKLNMLMLDSLILDFPNVKKWLDKHNGSICTENYATALPHSVSVHFEGSFSDALELFSLDGVRRALIAYWYETLIKKTEENKLSTYERYHNYNAVAKIMKRIKE